MAAPVPVTMWPLAAPRREIRVSQRTCMHCPVHVSLTKIQSHGHCVLLVWEGIASPGALGEVKLLWSPLEPPLLAFLPSGVWEDPLQKWPAPEASLAADTVPGWAVSLGPVMCISILVQR